MNEKTVKAYAELMALVATLEGMKFANEERLSECKSLAYGEESFLEIAHRMRNTVFDFDRRSPDEEA